MKLFKEQLQTLKESTAIKAKRPRIRVSHYEKMGITVSQKTCKPYIRIFGKKYYINTYEIPQYTEFTIYYE